MVRRLFFNLKPEHGAASLLICQTVAGLFYIPKNSVYIHRSWMLTELVGESWWRTSCLIYLDSLCWETTFTGQTGKGAASSACTSSRQRGRSSSTSCPTWWAWRPPTSTRSSVSGLLLRQGRRRQTMSAVLYCRALEMGIDNCSLVGWVRSSVWSFSSAAWKDYQTEHVLQVCKS